MKQKKFLKRVLSIITAATLFLSLTMGVPFHLPFDLSLTANAEESRLIVDNVHIEEGIYTYDGDACTLVKVPDEEQSETGRYLYVSKDANGGYVLQDDGALGSCVSEGSGELNISLEHGNLTLYLQGDLNMNGGSIDVLNGDLSVESDGSLNVGVISVTDNVQINCHGRNLTLATLCIDETTHVVIEESYINIAEISADNGLYRTAADGAFTTEVPAVNGANYFEGIGTSHIGNFKQSTDGTTHSKTCNCELNTIIESGSCAGGTATCTAQAVCETCCFGYGEIDSDKHHMIYTTEGSRIIETCQNDNTHTAALILDVPSNELYTGSPIVASVTGELYGIETPEIEYKDSQGNPVSVAVDAGEYTASITLENVDNAPLTASAVFTISKATPTITFSDVNSTYIVGQEVAVTAVAENPNNPDAAVPDVALTYQIGDGEATEFTDLFTIPEDTEARTVITITGSTAGTENYEAATQTKTMTVLKDASKCEHTYPNGECDYCGLICGTCGAEGDNLTWELARNEDGTTYTLTISGSGAMEDYGLGSAPWYDYIQKIANIIIPEGVTKIGDSAFFACAYLESVTIPKGVTTIGDGAFYGCSYLGTVTIPEGVTTIGSNAFKACNQLTEIIIPEGVTSIGAEAFWVCFNLRTVTIPNSVTSIGENAFKSCTSLTTVNVPCGWDTENPLYTFDSGITVNKADHTYPNGECVCGLICGTCGADGDNLKWTLDNGVLTISGTGAMVNKQMWDDYINDITSVVIESGVTSIGNEAFIRCDSLTSITIPEGVVSIGNDTFRDCIRLISVTIPESVDFIGDGAFFWCDSLTSITIPEGVVSIGNDTFRDCTSLISVTIPESVAFIGEYAFENIEMSATVNVPCSWNEETLYTFAYETTVNIAQHQSLSQSASGNVIHEECGVCEHTTGTLSITAENATYDGDSHGATVRCTGTLANAMISIEYFKGNDPLDFDEPTNAGTYTAKVTIGEATASVEYTIAQIDSVVTAVPVVADRTYDPSTTLAGIVLSGGTVKDVYGKVIEGSWSWVNPGTVPTVGNAGYEAVFTPMDVNYKTVTGTIAVTVAKATPGIGTVSAKEAVLYNTTDISVVELERTDESIAGTLELTAEALLYGAHGYVWKFTPQDLNNYGVLTGTVAIEVKDTIAPVASYKIGTGDWKSFGNSTAYETFSKEGLSVEIKAEDSGSGIASVQYYVAAMVGPSVSESPLIPWTDYTEAITLDANRTYVIYVKVTDNSGNEVILNSEGIVIYEDSEITTPELTHTYKEDADEEAVLILNTNTYAKITDAEGTELVRNTDYIATGDNGMLLIKMQSDYLATLDAGEYTYYVSVNPQGVETTAVELSYGFTIKVEKKTLTVDSVVSANRDYAAGDATVEVTGIQLSGIVTGDDVAIDLTGVMGTLSSDNAGTYTSVTLPALTLTGKDAGNYLLSVPESVATNVTIERASISADMVLMTLDVISEPYPENVLPGTVYVASDLGYSIAISWDPVDEEAGYNTVYTAKAYLTAAPNYTFAQDISLEDWEVVSNSGAVLVVKRSFEATDKASFIGMDSYEEWELTQLYENAEDVIADLPDTILVYTESEPNGVEMPITWSCESYDNSYEAENIFVWTIVPEAYADYDTNGYELSGELLVINPEPTELFVERLYEYFMNREADEEGLLIWVSYLRDGEMDAATVVEKFVLSDEFVNAEIADEEYVNILYNAILDREAEEDGFIFWTDALAGGMTRQEVLAGFTHSVEFDNLCDEYGITAVFSKEELVEKFVERMYTIVLEREAEPEGVSFWAAGLLDGSLTGSQMAKGFLHSDEFIGRNTSDEEYIKILYRAFLDREADDAGLNFWKEMLQQGMNRDEVLGGFIYSVEFSNICAEYGINAGTLE